MDEAKIRLSGEELSLAADSRVMLVKGAVMRKVSDLLGMISASQSIVLEGYQNLIPEALATSPKISKGENYRGQPYVVLDNPRHFKTDDIFAMRTMFLWGHHLSVTLHLRGTHRERFRRQLSISQPVMAAAGLLVCVGTSEWEHHFGADNFLPASEISQEEWERLWNDKDFTKVAYACPVASINDGVEPLMRAYVEILSLLG